MTTVFLASRNAGKLAEMHRILAPLVPGVSVLGLDDVAAYDEPVEDQPTFEGNALLKARAGVAATGLPSLADDTPDGRTSAELSVEEKDAISHRGKALRQIAPLVAQALG